MNTLKMLIKEALELEIKDIESKEHSKEDDVKLSNLHFIIDHIEHGEIEISYNQGKR
jgi:hypothetical protein